MKLIVRKAISTKTNNPYTALILEQNGYRTTLTFDKNIIMSVLNVTPRQFTELQCGEYEIA